MQPGVVSLTDCKSKFGTTVNGKKLEASKKIELHHNDVISFGQQPATAPSGFKSVHFYCLVLIVHLMHDLPKGICLACAVLFLVHTYYVQ